MIFVTNGAMEQSLAINIDQIIAVEGKSSNEAHESRYNCIIRHCNGAYYILEKYNIIIDRIIKAK